MLQVPTLRSDEPSRQSALQLVALRRHDYALTWHSLPQRGRVAIGRDPRCDVFIDSDSISRCHAALHMGSPILVEDCGSTNGTSVRGSRLAHGEKVEIHVNESIVLGDVTVILEPKSPDGAGAIARPLGSETPRPLTDSAAMASLLEDVALVAATDLTVLLCGETGVGKNVVARWLHGQSDRAQGPFVAINCPALSETLLGSELFGHKRGAFTGAEVDKPGLLEEANGGTVFLDEIGDLPPSIQAALLRVLQDREILPVGGTESRVIDVRFVCATNRDLQRAVERGEFRRDLYYRIEGDRVEIPPLRHRSEEIPALVRHFIAEYCGDGRHPMPVVSPAAMDALQAYEWPGNVRELRSAVQRGVVRCRGGVLRPEHLRLPSPRPQAPLDAAPRHYLQPDPALIRDLSANDRHELEQTVAALEQVNGNQTRAAELLDISRSALIRRIVRFGIPRPRM